MTSGTFDRREICALSLDVVGYSRMLAADPDATVRALSQCTDIIESVAKAYDGTIITRAGDGFLIGFNSPLRAVKSAIACQTKIRARNTAKDCGKPIWLRAGIACGKIIDDGHTAHGDCLNISVRMQEAAPSGGILMTRSVHEQVTGDLAYQSNDVGDFHFKNLELNIRGIELLMDGADVFNPVEPLLDLVTISGEVEKMAGFDRHTALAVFPISAKVPAKLSGTDDTILDAIGEGISDSLISALSHMRQFPVIERGSSFHYRDSELPPPRIWKILGAAYVITGEISRRSAGFHLTLRLIYGKDAQTIWTETFTIPADGLTGFVDDISVMVAGTIESRIENEEGLRSRSTQLSKLDLNALVWRARWHAGRLTKADTEQARTLLDKVLEKEPDFPEALMQKAHLDWLDCWSNRKGKSDVKAMITLARKAMAMTPDDSRGHCMIGCGFILLGKPDRALEYLRHANALNPGYALALMQMGICHTLIGEPKQAVQYINRALRLNPNDYYVFAAYGELATAYCLTGEWDHALGHARKSRSLRNNYLQARVTEITALVGQGDMSNAAKAYDALALRRPEFCVKALMEWMPFQKQSARDLFTGSLERAQSAALIRSKAFEKTGVKL